MSSLISITQSGSFKKIERFCKRIIKHDVWKYLDKFGKMGVEALSAATPVDTGLTAASWKYEIQEDEDSYSIIWINTNKDSRGVPIVLLLQYGHGTRDGGYVRGLYFIRPAISPVSDALIEVLWKDVISDG